MLPMPDDFPCSGFREGLIPPLAHQECDDIMTLQQQATNPEAIYLTPEAIAMAHELETEDPERKGKSLRLYLDGKGCDGFYYGVAFDEPLPDDLHFPQGGIDLIVDRDSYDFCMGSKIEWVDDERGRGFLVDNPHQRKFRGKFYKRKSWQDRLQAKQRGEKPPAHESTSGGESV